MKPRNIMPCCSKKPLLIACVALSSMACTQDFDPYNEVIGFRLLAIAADEPWLAAGNSTVLSALVATDPESSDPLSYRWSWCPLSTGSLGGYECAVTHDEIQTQLDEAFGRGVVVIPSFELGTTETATFTYSLSPFLLAGLCEALAEGNIPDFVEVPECAGRYPISIRLEVTAGDRTIVGVKNIELVLEGTATNHNPVIDGIGIRRPGEEETTPLARDDTMVLARDVEHTLELDLDEATAETYTSTASLGTTPTTERERLVVTWFVEGGETDKIRTSYLDGEIPLDRTKTNKWRTPKKVDYGKDTARLWIVIRDGRQGVSWLSREVGLED